MRKIESVIIKAINYEETSILSKRDRVVFEPFNACNKASHVYLWNTRIAIILPDSIIINSGGWKTVTTKSRLNSLLREYCGVALYQKRREWYVVNPWKREEERQFEDNMTIRRTR